MTEKTPGNAFIFLMLLIFMSASYRSPAQIVLHDDLRDIYISGEYLGYLIDEKKQWGIEDVQAKDFAPPGVPLLRNEEPEAVYWVKLRIENRARSETRWLLEALSPNLYTLDVWIPDDEGMLRRSQAGLSQTYLKPYAHKNYVFDLPSGKETYEVYARVWSPLRTGIEFKIHAQKNFIWYALKEYFYLGLFYGLLLIMMVYNLLVFATNREKVNLFYALYLFSCMFYVLSEDGLGVELLWKDLARYNIHFGHHISPSLFLLSFVFYARSFLELPKNFRLADKAVVLSAVTFPVLKVVEPYLPESELFNMENYYLIPFGIVFIASIYVYRKGYRSARFFILGYNVVFVCMILLQLRLHRLIDSNIFTVYIFNFGILVEAVILSFAMADRLRNIRKAKEEADKELLLKYQENTDLQKQLVQELEEKNLLSQKVNRELEQKVQQRTEDLQKKTQELILANEKLDLYAKKLTDMNVKLDLDNWQLKKDVKNERIARIVKEELSYDDFMRSFPDNSACLRYLEDLKWAQGFTCKKCNNTRYKAKLFSRKCTRCDHIESPTSNTLLHGTKIPLNKAFYMIYVSTGKKKKYTLDELSDLLKIGKNTCWEFRKKVKARQAERQNMRSKDKENWELLILDEVLSK